MEDRLRRRFEDKYQTLPWSGCWVWTASINPDGYGIFQLGSRRDGRRHFAAHRVSYQLNIGSVPDGMCVLHRCDNPSCVNPAHLFLGTQKINSDDKISKGRFIALSRERNGMAKLTSEQVVAIRSDVRTHREIAKDYGISYGHVSKLKRHQNWHG